MSLTLEIPVEIENQLREAAAREGREVSVYLLERATEKLLTLEEVDARTGSYSGHAAELIELELLDFRVVRGQKFVSDRDLAHYESERLSNPDRAMDEMVGLNQLWGLYDDGAPNPMIKT